MFENTIQAVVKKKKEAYIHNKPNQTKRSKTQPLSLLKKKKKNDPNERSSTTSTDPPTSEGTSSPRRHRVPYCGKATREIAPKIQVRL